MTERGCTCSCSSEYVTCCCRSPRAGRLVPFHLRSTVILVTCTHTFILVTDERRLEVRTHTCAHRQTRRHSHRRVLIQGFPAFKLLAGQFSFWFSLPASLPSGAAAATTFCLVCAASPAARPNVRSCGGLGGLEAGTRREMLRGTDRFPPAPAAAGFHVACSGPPRNSDQNHKWIRRSARRHKTIKAVPALGSYLF